MATFRVGDRVRTKIHVGNNTFVNTVGFEGTIIIANHEARMICVEFDNFISGHDGHSYDGIGGRDGHCWYVAIGDLEKIKKEKKQVELDFEEGKTYICDCCGKEIEGLDGHIFTDNNGDTVTVCQDCFSENYARCRTCGDIVAIEDADYIDDDGDVYCCEDCTDGYFVRCYDCGELTRKTEAYSIASRYGNGNEYICEVCRENSWSYCDGCDELFRWGDLSDGYCDNCYDENEYNDGYDGICDYHSGPSFRYYNKPHEYNSNGAGFKGYGFELEVDCGGSYNDKARTVVEMLNQEAYCAHDGSIDDGFEIISHPHTREAIEAMPMDDVLSWLVRNGYRSHNAGTCGLHLHASKLLFGDDEKERIKNIAKIVMFYEIFWDDILKISRRKPGQVDRWARKYGRGKKDTFDMVDKVIKGQRYSDGRYFAVNLSNKHTVEFRLMRGTLKKETFWATLDFLMTTVENTKNITQ